MTPLNKDHSDKEATVPSDAELEKSNTHIIVEIIEHMTNAVVIKTIIKKSTGNVSVMSFDSGKRLPEKTSPFESFAQIIEGKGQIVINNFPHTLNTGEGFVKPAHTASHIIPNGIFKMILTIIKSFTNKKPIHGC